MLTMTKAAITTTYKQIAQEGRHAEEESGAHHTQDEVNAKMDIEVAVTWESVDATVVVQVDQVHYCQGTHR